MVDWNPTALEQAQFNNAETFAVDSLSEVTCSGNLLPRFNPLANAYLNIDNVLNFPNPTTLISSYHHCIIIIPQGVDVGDCARNWRKCGRSKWHRELPLWNTLIRIMGFGHSKPSEGP